MAFSVRRLRSDYTGPLLRVRRSSDNAEADIGFTPGGDVDVAALLAHVGAGSGFVRTWYDQSGNGRHAAQTIAALQPQIVNGGALTTINGLPALRFIAASLTRLLFTAPSTGALNMFAVVRGTGSAAGVTIAGSGGSGSVSTYLPIAQQGQASSNVIRVSPTQNDPAGCRMFANGNLVPIATRGAAWSAMHEARGSAVRFSDIPMGVGAIDRIGATSDSHTFALDGVLPEFILLTSPLTAQQIQTLETNQMIVFGISPPFANFSFPGNSGLAPLFF